MLFCICCILNTDFDEFSGAVSKYPTISLDQLKIFGYATCKFARMIKFRKIIAASECDHIQHVWIFELG